MKAIRKSDYTQPTPIQSQAVPAALSGRDIIGNYNIYIFYSICYNLLNDYDILHRYC